MQQATPPTAPETASSASEPPLPPVGKAMMTPLGSDDDPTALSLKGKAMKIQFELALDQGLGIKETLRQANEYLGLEAKGTPSAQANALFREMGL